MFFKRGKTQQHQISNNDIFYTKFKNAGSSDLNVDGTTPQVFTLEDLTNEKIILTRVEFLISAGTAIDLNNFGDITALVNGVEFNIDGVQTFNTNGDILLFATDSTTEIGRVFGAETAFINGHWNTMSAFQNGLVCNVADLTITVQDDLSELNFFQIAASGLKIS